MYSKEWADTKKKYMSEPTEVNIKDLTATERDQDSKQIKEILESKEDLPPVYVIKYKGKLYLEDGHHRTSAASLKGKSSIKAKVLDLDSAISGKEPSTIKQTDVVNKDNEVIPQEEAALEEYQSGFNGSAIGGYANINTYLRSGKPKFGQFTDDQKKLVESVSKLVSSAIQKHQVKEPMTVYRGMKINDEPGMEQYKDLKVGSVIQDKGFTSTSVSKKVADKFSEKLNRKDQPVIMEISLKQGDYALPMDKYHKHSSEKEILLDKNTKFKVTEVKERSGVKYVKLEIID